MTRDIVHVAIQKAPSYDTGLCEQLKTALTDSGFMDLLRASPSRVLVKPNLIHAALPDMARTTHPAVVESVVNILQDEGHEVILADSYSGARLWNESGLRSVYRKTGMDAVAERTGCRLNWDTRWSIREIPSGSVIKRVEMMNVVDEVDWIVNIPKLKTHVYTGFTAAVKNMFGLVPGHFKVSYHARFADAQTFACALSDIALSFPVRLTVVDAIMAMEGNGPTGGTPRHVGAVFMGDDMLAVDTVAARICGYDPGVFHWLPSRSIEINGLKPESLLPGALRRPDSHKQGMGVFSNSFIRSLGQRILRDVFAPVPTADITQCVQCGDCVNACPTSAMIQYDKHAAPKVLKDRCIRCYCCHEACQHTALIIDPPRFARWFA